MRQYNRPSLTDNGLLPVRHKAIVWTDYGFLSIGTLGTSFSEIIIKIQIFSFKKMYLKILYAKLVASLSRPQCVNKQTKHELSLKICRLSLSQRNISLWAHLQITNGKNASTFLFWRGNSLWRLQSQSWFSNDFNYFSIKNRTKTFWSHSKKKETQ